MISKLDYVKKAPTSVHVIVLTKYFNVFNACFFLGFVFILDIIDIFDGF